MPDVRARLSSTLCRDSERTDGAAALAPAPKAACAWDAMRAVSQEQAERGVPEAMAGLELIEQDRWPTSGRPRS